MKGKSKEEMIRAIVDGWIAKARLLNAFCMAEGLKPYATREDIRDLIEELNELSYEQVKRIYLFIRSLIRDVRLNPECKVNLALGFDGCPFCLINRLHFFSDFKRDPTCLSCLYGRRHGMCTEEDSDFMRIKERLIATGMVQEVMERILEAWIGALKVKNFKRRSGS